jgi:hypothetical protein
MSLATLNWKKTAPVNVAASTVAGALDALYSCLTKTTYEDGSARSAGSGSAWTAGRYQIAGPVTEAVYCTPPTGAINHRLIFAGSTTAKTPTMASPDTWATNIVLAGLAKNAGAFNAWDNAAPFTSGQFYGYWRAANTGSGTFSRVWIIESQEALFVVVELTTGVCIPILGGAYLDPESSTAGACESDGARYGLAVGSATAWASNSFQSGTNFLGHSASNAQYHHMVADVGAVATFAAAKLGALLASNSSTALKNQAGEAVVLPTVVVGFSGTPNDYFYGVTRQFGLRGQVVSGTKRTNTSAVIQFYNASYSTAAAGDGLGFKV